MVHSLGWFRDGSVELAKRPVHTYTLSDEVAYIKPKARTY
jgi:succinate dehydrogenase / fumarate reductase flavoprotein subunit